MGVVCVVGVVAVVRNWGPNWQVAAGRQLQSRCEKLLLRKCQMCQANLSIIHKSKTFCIVVVKHIVLIWHFRLPPLQCRGGSCFPSRQAAAAAADFDGGFGWCCMYRSCRCGGC